ncbi:hypothetical protein [Streptomyces yangpuensis]|uniref:hypothetical protein n=1 Tax=Streptomyces yangpuensis TaxID=1648182 RepID=UPI00365C2F01
MGGRQHTQRGRRGRSALRRAVLLTVLGMLVGALFLCARSGDSPASSEVRADGTTHHTADGTNRATTHGTAHGTAPAVCVSPYEPPGCSPLAHVPPAVLPVPPPAVTVTGGGPLPSAHTTAAGRIRPPEALARAPDLHVLQVLRT